MKQGTRFKNGQNTWIDISLKNTCKWLPGIKKLHKINNYQRNKNKNHNEYLFIHVRMVITKKQQQKVFKCKQGWGKIETIIHCWWACRMVLSL